MGITGETINTFDVTFTPTDGRKVVIEYKKAGDDWDNATVVALAADATSPHTVSVDPLTSDVNADPNANADQVYNVRVKTVHVNTDDHSQYSTVDATTGND